MEGFDKIFDSDSYEPLLSPFLDDNQMTYSWTTFDPEGSSIHTYPTPPYDPEDQVLDIMTATESPSKSLRDSLDSESLFGELSGVNFADVLLESASETNTTNDNQVSETNIMQATDKDTEILNSFVKEIDELGIDLELDNNENLLQQVSEESVSVCENVEVTNVNESDDNVSEKSVDKPMSVVSFESESEEDDLTYFSQQQPNRTHIPRPAPTASRGKEGPHLPREHR